MKRLALASLVLVALQMPAHTYSIYDSTCAMPTTDATAKTFYVDPVRGATQANGGDGSQAHPWDSLNAVLSLYPPNNPPYPGYSVPPLLVLPYNHKAVNAAGTKFYADTQAGDPNHLRVWPGDTVLLKSGNYGNLTLGVYQYKLANLDAKGHTKMVVIKNDAGATPVFSTIRIGGSTGFYFQGLKVQSLLSSAPANYAHVTIGGNAATPTRDIAFVGGTVGTYDSNPHLSQANLQATQRNGFTISGDPDHPEATQCVSVNSNNIRWVGNGAILDSYTDKFLASSNTISYFSGDAFDAYSTSNARFNRNLVLDRVDDANGGHTDCFQIGHNFGNLTHWDFTNIEFSQNQCYQTWHADNPYPGYLQGVMITPQLGPNGQMDTFTNVRILDNKIVISTGNGIEVSKTHNSLIANNTVVWAGLPLPQGGAVEVAISEDAKSSNNVFVNNVANGFGQSLDPTTNGSRWLKNLAVPSLSGSQVVRAPSVLWPNHVKNWYTAAGVYNGVTIDAASPSDAFMNYAPSGTGLASSSSPNLAPLPNGALDGKGVVVPGGPTVNINGMPWPEGVPNIGAF